MQLDSGQAGEPGQKPGAGSGANPGDHPPPDTDLYKKPRRYEHVSEMCESAASRARGKASLLDKSGGRTQVWNRDMHHGSVGTDAQDFPAVLVDSEVGLNLQSPLQGTRLNPLRRLEFEFSECR